MRRVGYIRVSTLLQNTERQLDGVQLDKTFTDHASGRDTKRPALQEALAYLALGDTLVVHSTDRLARNTEDMLRILRELTSRGVTVEFVTNNMRFFPGESDPVGKMVLTILACVAEMERANIRERQLEGVAIAKKKGVYKGRKPALDHTQTSALRSMRKIKTATECAKAFHISRQSVGRYTA